MFSALSVGKFAASAIVGLGTGKVVSGIVKNHVAPANLFDKVSITAATWVLSGIATAATKKYTNDTIDEVVGNVNKTISTIKVQSKLKRINNGESTFESEGLDETQYEKNADGQWVPTKTTTDAVAV